MSTLLGPAVVLVAILATLRIALSQLDQPATTRTQSRRALRRHAVPGAAGDEGGQSPTLGSQADAREHVSEPGPGLDPGRASEPVTVVEPGPTVPDPQVEDSVAVQAARARRRRAERARGGRSPVASMMTPAMPAGFQWIDATPTPKVRSGFALAVILAILGALLAVAVAGLVMGIAVAIQGTV